MFQDGSAINSSQATAVSQLNPSREWMIQVAINLLESEGYMVAKAPKYNDWITPRQYHERFPHLSNGGFNKRINHPHAPFFEKEKSGETKRMVRLRPTPALDAFMSQPVSEGAALKSASLILRQSDTL